MRVLSEKVLKIGDLTIDEFRGLIGSEIGESGWVTVTQDMINRFSEATLDPDPMHVDPTWCDEHSPFRKPVAFGFMTLALVIHMLHDLMGYRSQGANEDDYPQYGLNYGVDGVRFISPVPVDSRIRGRFVLTDLKERKPGEFLQTMEVTIEVEGQSRPALVAQWYSLFVSEEGHSRVANSASSA